MQKSNDRKSKFNRKNLNFFIYSPNKTVEITWQGINDSENKVRTEITIDYSTEPPIIKEVAYDIDGKG